jgi:hypothetical protein
LKLREVERKLLVRRDPRDHAGPSYEEPEELRAEGS